MLKSGFSDLNSRSYLFRLNICGTWHGGGEPWLVLTGGKRWDTSLFGVFNHQVVFIVVLHLSALK